MKCDENQTVEYKQSWQDKYLEWICGYANAKGGTLYIGVENSLKNPVGLRNSDKLMEDIPNSVRNTMGIVPDIALVRVQGKPVVRIRVKPSSFPVSCRGGYFYRTGAVKMQLVGNALTEFILHKTGTSWDAFPNASGRRIRDCRFAVLASHCLDQTGRRFEEPDFRSFGLADDAGVLTNAGALFADDSFVYQNRLFCTRWNGLDKGAGVMDALDDKEYAGSILSLFEYGRAFVKTHSRTMWHKLPARRVEFPDYPERAVEEAIANALVHRDYTVFGSEVHIDIYDDRLEVVSPGGMFDGGAPIQERPDLRAVGSSRRNPVVADLFGRLRYAERRGSGLGKILDAYASPVPNPANRLPSFDSGTFFTVRLPNLTYDLSKDALVAAATAPTPDSRAAPNSRPIKSTGQVDRTSRSDKSTGQVDRTSRPDKSTGQVDRISRIRRVATTLPSENRATLLISLVGARDSSRRELMDAIGLRHRENFYRMYLLPALDLGLIEYTIPGKPNSRLQKYRLTAKGRAALARSRG